MRRGLWIAFLCLGVAQIARADRGELRLSAAANLPAFASVDQSGGSGSSTTWGGHLGAREGVTDSLELGGVFGFSGAENIRFSGATVSGLHGDLWGDLLLFELAGTARLVGPALLHAHGSVRPFLDARGGLAIRTLSSQIALDSRDRLIARPDDSSSVLPFVGGTLGIEHRFSDTYSWGLAADLTYAGSDYTAAAISLEVSWLRF